jgi:hypothetical protein
MSAILFHSLEDDEVRVSGRERANAGVLCGNLLAVSLSIDGYWMQAEMERYKTLLEPSSYLLTEQDPHRFQASFKTWLSVGHGNMLLSIDGENKLIDTFSLALNTAIRLGSNPLKLIARLHGQCEIHAYIEGENRNWAADVIEEGRSFNLLRKNMGWEDAITLLRKRSDSPIVTSYTVCDPFPSKPEQLSMDYEVWDNLKYETQWDVAIKALREKSKTAKLEIKPDNDVLFNDGLTGFDIMDILYAA